MKSANDLLRFGGTGNDHQIQLRRAFGESLLKANRRLDRCHGSSGPGATSDMGISTSFRGQMMKRRGRDWGRNRDASTTSAPAEYPPSSTASQIAAKSFPSRELRVPQTFSSTMRCGARSSAMRPFINRQNGQNVPERSPSRPAPAPASERSWHGKDAHASRAVPGTSAVVSEFTSTVLSSPSPQLSL